MNSELSNIIKRKCLEAGFAKVGFARAEELTKEKMHLVEWLKENRNADMNWMNNNFEKRVNPINILPDAASVISLAYIYDTPVAHPDDETVPKISRYAWGQRDYHKLLKKKLKILCKQIESIYPGIKTKFYADDGPIMDKAWAVRAGIGWTGKNTNVINKEIGSFFFLADILINTKLEYDVAVEDLCKTCRLCIDACPTGALYEEYKIDANLCISYQTIENRNEIPAEIDLNGWVFGCDVCQDVCPFNGKQVFTDDMNFFPRKELSNKTYDEYLKMNEDDFNRLFEGTPVKRAKYKGFIRNLHKAKNK